MIVNKFIKWLRFNCVKFWFKKIRTSVTATWILSIFVNIGMWFERFVIIVTSLYRDYLPSSWSVYYSPSIYEVGFYLGTFGLFFTCFFLFAKYFPVIAVAEIKYVLKEAENPINLNLKNWKQSPWINLFTIMRMHINYNID